MFVDWKPGEETVDDLKAKLERIAVQYRDEYAAYYKAWATAGLA